MTMDSSVVWRALRRTLLGLAVLALLPYAWGPMYRFPDISVFSGPAFWNPYASARRTWQRANLHAHGRAWGGLTSGEQSDAAVTSRYRVLGYAVAGVSNYQRIAAVHGVDAPLIYEHGINIGKVHQLAIGAHRVDWFDFPLWQTLNNQQYVIDRVKRTADLVSLNHPNTRDAYPVSAMRALTGYDLVEIVNGPFAAEDVWDAALSSGHPVWAVANDDTHDLNDPHRTAAGWNMIDAASASTADIVAALRDGRFYAVRRTGALENADITTLSSLSIHDGALTVRLDGAPSTISFIGQHGAVRRSVTDVITASYTMTAADTYVRVVVTSPQTVLYLNPVLRWNGSSLPAPTASVDLLWTWGRRVALALLCALLWLRLRRRASRQIATSPNR